MPIVIDKLANHGVTFTNTFATTPLCTPSRTSILTGNYAHHTGATANYAGPPVAHSSTVATWLHMNGYRTGFFGKFPQTVINPAPPGWDTLEVFTVIGSFNYVLTQIWPNGSTTSVSYGSNPEDYATDVLAQRVVDFMDIPSPEPFFVCLATYAPHAETPLPVPAPRDVGTWSNIPPWRPANYDEDDILDKPLWLQGLPRATDPFGFFTRGSWGDIFHQYQLEALQAVDRAVGRIVGELEATGMADNTVIIFTSDNGMSWGEHRLWESKNVAYEESIRLPLVVRYPNMIASPREATDLVLNIDLAPTIAQLAGTVPSTPVDGQSLLPILRDQPTAWRSDSLIETWTGGGPFLAAVRTNDWKFVEYSDGETELYGLLNDPYELTNVSGDPMNQDRKAALSARIRQLQQ